MSEVPSDAAPTIPAGNVLLRLVWMAGFPIILLLALRVAREPHWTFGMHDLLLWGVVAAVVAARTIDALYYRGTTATGDRATTVDVVRYSAILVVVTTGLWILGHAIHL